MSLVGRVGRRRPRARFAMAVVYCLLCLGAVTTLGPFLLMVSTGLKGSTDQNDHRIVPAYLHDDAELLTKYLDDKYAADTHAIAGAKSGDAADARTLAKYNAFLLNLPLNFWQAGFGMAPNAVTSRLRRRYQAWLETRYRSIDAVNRRYVEEAVAFETIDTPSELLTTKTWQPPNALKYKEWLIFKASLPAEFRVPMRKNRMFAEWAAGQYRNRFADVPLATKGPANNFDELEEPASGKDREKFESTYLPARYRNGAAEARWAAIDAGPLPLAAFDRDYVARHAGEIRREFAGRNYRYALDYLLLNSRAMWNTVVFCSLAILTQLIVNPLAAYALSRYPIRGTGAILIFLLATMAFPAEVAMIPSFLLLKNLGLLNTFAALVLPSAASGYMIFLLKGFFDSLPPELFEAGQLDGAKESTMMLRVAFPLSRPVLGYLALLAFMGAYSTFMYAFLVVQDQRMWTITVWIYQLQQVAPTAVVMAALTLAALPTLVVFLCAQNVIMRGIVLPGER